MYIKRFISCFILVTLMVWPHLVLKAQEGINTITRLDNGTILLADFEQYETDTIPFDWYNRDGDMRPAAYTEKLQSGYDYKILEEDGNKFLRYNGSSAKHLNFPLVGKGIDIHKTPILSFKVRAHMLPERGNEASDDRNDSAVGVYVVFDMGRVLLKRVPKSIKYAWSTELERGRELSKFFGNQKVVIIESGPEELGEWKTFERNIVADYRRLFGDRPPSRPIALLILSDGDSTNSPVMVDYDDIMLKPLD